MLARFTVGAMVIVVAFLTLAFASGHRADHPTDVVAVAVVTPTPEATPTPAAIATPTAEPAEEALESATGKDKAVADDGADDAVVGADYIPSFVTDDLSGYGAHVSAPVVVTEATPAPPVPARTDPTPAAASAPTLEPAPTPVPADEPDPIRDDDAEAPTGADWAALRGCESGGNYGAASGNGYFGAYQFSQATWDWVASIAAPRWVGELPSEAPPGVQDTMAVTLYDLRGPAPWPTCGAHLT